MTAATIGVQTWPGAIAFTLIRLSASWGAREMVSPMTPSLVVG